MPVRTRSQRNSLELNTQEMLAIVDNIKPRFVSYDELCEMELTIDSKHKCTNYKLVIDATLMADYLNMGYKHTYNGLYAVAPSGWYWKQVKPSNDQTEWFELSHIPNKYL